MYNKKSISILLYDLYLGLGESANPIGERLGGVEELDQEDLVLVFVSSGQGGDLVVVDVFSHVPDSKIAEVGGDFGFQSR